jgi:DNA mismatch endonuclease, patch repair protein
VTDFLSSAERSTRMASVRQRRTAPERDLARALHAAALRYRLNASELPGRPDLVFPRHGTVIFVNGCFWHGHHCPAGRAPSSRQDYWLPKLQANRDRDRRKARLLRRMGWRVLTVWECQLDTRARLERTAAALAARVRSGR